VHKLFIVFIGLAVLLPGCSSTTDVSVGIPVTFSARIASQAGFGKNAVAPDSISLSRVRVVIRHVRFMSSSDSSDLRSAPSVIDLGTSTDLRDIFVSSLPPGNYSGVRIKVHRIENSDLAGMSSPEMAVFADFLAGDRYSVIVEGTVYEGGTVRPFVYRSRIDEVQERQFAEPMVVSASGPVTVTMLLGTDSWFRSSTGALLDPADPANEGPVDDNIKSSIDVFEDNDRNGFDD